MALPLTKLGRDVFAPVTAGGAPRGADMGDAVVLTTEYEKLLEALVAAAGDITLTDDVISAINSGAGTADSVQATASNTVSTAAYSQLITVNFTAANTGAMDISINGETPRELVTNTGEVIPAGYIKAGMVALIQIDGNGDYRLFSYGDATAIQAAAEAAQAAAEAARDEAVGAVPSLILGNIAALRSFAAATAVVLASVMGYTSALQPAGAGDFRLDASDTTTADDGGMVIVDAAGRRWKRQATDMKPEYYGALGFSGSMASYDYGIAPVGYVDDADAIQKANDYLDAKGGGVIDFERWHFANTPLTISYGVSLRGANKASCGIIKDSDTAATVTYYDSAAPGQVAIYPGSLPTSAKAVLILGKAYANGRWVGNITGLTIGSTLATAGDSESQKNEFGILSIGSISDFVIDDNNVNFCEYGMLIPTPFVGQITNNRVHRCLHGIGIGNCTTLTMYGNYASECRDYGYAFRASKYSDVFANACDMLNDPTLYPDRTRECSAYVVNSCIGVSFYNNGQEGTYGNSWHIDTIMHCDVIGNTMIRLGSDYSGAEEIAIWKVQGAIINSNIIYNNGYSQQSGGIIQGSANPAKHHNVYVAPGTHTEGSSIHTNIYRDAAGGLGTEAGWLNNVGNFGLIVRDGGIFSRSAPSAAYGNILQGTGETSSTNSLDVRNGSGTSMLRLRDDGAFFTPAIYGQTTTAPPDMFIGSDGSQFRSTYSVSALKYKDVIGPIPDDMVDKVMAQMAVLYTMKDDAEKQRQIGFVADYFHEAGLHELVIYGKDGQVEGLYYARIVAVTVEAHRRLEARVTAIEARL